MVPTPLMRKSGLRESHAPDPSGEVQQDASPGLGIRMGAKCLCFLNTRNSCVSCSLLLPPKAPLFRGHLLLPRSPLWLCLAQLQPQGLPCPHPQASPPGLVQPAAQAWEHQRLKPLPVRPHCSSLLTLFPDFASSQSPMGQEVGLHHWSTGPAGEGQRARRGQSAGRIVDWRPGYPGEAQSGGQKSGSPGFESWAPH